MSAEVMVRVACAECGRAVESDVLTGEQLVALLGWSDTEGHVLCVTCRQEAGSSPALVLRVLARG